MKDVTFSTMPMGALFHFPLSRAFKCSEATRSIGCKEKESTVSRLQNSTDWDKLPMALFSKSCSQNSFSRFSQKILLLSKKLLNKKIFSL